MKINKICLVAGNSAGHILPALTLAQKLKTNQPNTQIIFFSNDTKLDQDLLNQKPVIHTHIKLSLMTLPYKKPWKMPKFIWQILKALKTCYQTLKYTRPNEIISTGGLVAIPVCLIARYLKIPITIYELNVEPGKATKLLAKIATNVSICFAQTQKFLPKTNCRIVSYPIRFTPQDYQLTCSQAFEIINQIQPTHFKPERKTILILGGSQGSLFINQLIPKFILKSQTHDLQIIHQTGSHAIQDLVTFYQAQNISALVFDYQANLMPYYRAADLIICRAGAGTLAEIIPLKTACMTIPLETGYTSHQVQNALAVAQEHSQIKVLKQAEIINNFELFRIALDSILFASDYAKAPSNESQKTHHER